MPMPIPDGVADAAPQPKPLKQGASYRLCFAQYRRSAASFARSWSAVSERLGGAREPDRHTVLGEGDGSGGRGGLWGGLPRLYERLEHR